MQRILIVEDDRNQRLLYEEELSAEGYVVDVAVDGKEAVEKAAVDPPDLVILDISMPGMNGIEAMGKILGENNKIPIILNTAYASYKDNFMTWAAEAYIVKSSDLAQLKATVKEILLKRQAEQGAPGAPGGSSSS
jgi:DNA-binding response OmpR family regulator